MTRNFFLTSIALIFIGGALSGCDFINNSNGNMGTFDSEMEEKMRTADSEMEEKMRTADSEIEEKMRTADSELENGMRTFELKKDSVQSDVFLLGDGDAVASEVIIITTPFNKLNLKTKEDAKKYIKQEKEKEVSEKGILTTYKIKDSKIIYTKDIDYKKVDFSKLGITEHMLTKEGTLPSLKIRVEDYKNLGYEETK